MDEQSTAAQSGGSDGFSSILNGILSNPEMMAMISSMAGKLKSENAPAENEAAEASETAAPASAATFLAIIMLSSPCSFVEESPIAVATGRGPPVSSSASKTAWLTTSVAARAPRPSASQIAAALRTGNRKRGA